MIEHPTSDQLASFADGQLSRASARAVASHLDTCAQCAREALVSRQLADLDSVGLLPQLTIEDRNAAVEKLRRLSRQRHADRKPPGSTHPVEFLGLVGGALGLGTALSPADAHSPTPVLLATSTTAPAPARSDDTSDQESSGSEAAAAEGVGGEKEQTSDDAVRTDEGHASGEQDELFPGLTELEALLASSLDEGVGTHVDPNCATAGTEEFIPAADADHPPVNWGDAPGFIPPGEEFGGHPGDDHSDPQPDNQPGDPHSGGDAQDDDN